MATALQHDSAGGEQPTPSIKPATPSKRRFILPIVAVLVVAALIWAGKLWSYGRSHESTDDAAVDGHLIPVLAKVSGYVQKVTVDDNAHVGADSLLVQIDPTEYKMRLEQADADLAAAKASAGVGGAGQAQAQVATAAGQQAALQAQIAAAKANATNAQQNLARMRELAAKQIVSKQQLDAAQAAADAAAANVVAVERQAGAASATVTSAEAGVRLADARLQAAQAARDNAALQLDYTHVAAPAAGIVSKKQVEVGQLIQVGQPLLTIVADTGAYVTANFKETQLADIRVGQPVDVDVDAYGCTAKGRVESVSAATGSKFALLPPDNATGNFTKVVQRVPVRVAIVQGCGANQPLRPGLSVDVHVATK